MTWLIPWMKFQVALGFDRKDAAAIEKVLRAFQYFNLGTFTIHFQMIDAGEKPVGQKRIELAYRSASPVRLQVSIGIASMPGFRYSHGEKSRSIGVFVAAERALAVCAAQTHAKIANAVRCGI